MTTLGPDGFHYYEEEESESAYSQTDKEIAAGLGIPVAEMLRMPGAWVLLLEARLGWTKPWRGPDENFDSLEEYRKRNILDSLKTLWKLK